MKTLHVYLYTPQIDGLLTGYMETKNAIEYGVEEIYTTQPHFCSNDIIYGYGYEIIVHTSNLETIFMTKGGVSGCNKVIRSAHNLEKMLFAGAFGEL